MFPVNLRLLKTPEPRRRQLLWCERIYDMSEKLLILCVYDNKAYLEYLSVRLFISVWFWCLSDTGQLSSRMTRYG